MSGSGERKTVGSVAGSLLIVGVIGLMIYVFGTGRHYGFGFPIGLVVGFFYRRSDDSVRLVEDKSRVGLASTGYDSVSSGRSGNLFI